MVKLLLKLLMMNRRKRKNKIETVQSGICFIELYVCGIYMFSRLPYIIYIFFLENIIENLATTIDTSSTTACSSKRGAVVEKINIIFQNP